MTAYKHKIMEALLSPNNNLTKEDIAWASENIPNENLEEPIVYNHDEGSIMDACGFNKDMLKKTMEEYRQLRKADDFEKKSQVIEYLINNASNALTRYLIIRGIIDVESDNEKMYDELKKFLDKL
jgi:hypothetical protein